MSSISLDQQPAKHWVTKESRNGGLSLAPYFSALFGL
jgi:hypothetical protein